MADIVGYRQWLATLPRQPAFLHNYWCALLAYDMEETKILETFKIPYFILEEELMKEDNNIYLVKGQEPYISAPLRHYLVHLLKPYDENTNVLNVEVILRAFIHNEIDLPPGVFAPLHSSTHFHMIPSECKLWLLFKIRNHKNHPIMPRTVATDALGNSYFIVPDCRLYVRIATSEHIALAIDEETLRGQPWEELYRFVNSQSCLLLSENAEGWDVVRNAFQFFKLNDLIYAIRPDITVRCSAQNLATMMNNVTTPANLNDINQNVAAMNLNENTPANKPEIKPRQKTSNQINGKCWNFPQCPLKHICKYVHPRIPCSKFPNCPRGWECLFLHEFCPNDADCVELNCPYEHVMSKPTYYRMKRDPEPETSLPSPVSGQLASPPEAKKRCAYFPKCSKIHKGDFFHPTEPCRSLAASQMCAGLFCLFIHGPCPNDDSCISMTCIYEHYQSPLVIERRLAVKSKKGQTLSRAPSMSNLSTCSKRSRRSVTFDLDSDGESVVSNKRQDTTSQKPKSILKTTPQRDHCPVFPQCPNGGLCIFTHDLCKNDGVCSKEDCDYDHLLPHPIANSWCKNGSRCTLIDCSELHPKECIGRCPMPGNCWMYHRIAAAATAAAAAPQAPPTPAPRTTAPRAQTMGPRREPQGTNGSQSTRPHLMGPQGMGPPSFPGYGHAFPYGHPAGYGYGQPNYGYGPGYAPGYWQHPGYGGYGPGMPYGPQYGPGPGPRGHFPAPVPGFGPPTPPPHHQYSASESPPPVYRKMSEQKRKMFERKQELGESTRL